MVNYGLNYVGPSTAFSVLVLGPERSGSRYRRDESLPLTPLLGSNCARGRVDQLLLDLGVWGIWALSRATEGDLGTVQLVTLEIKFFSSMI